MSTSWLRAEVTLAAGQCGSDLALAARFGVPVATELRATAWQLFRTAGRMQLRAPSDLGGLVVDLSPHSGPLAQRLRSARRTDALPRACGLARRVAPLRVVDATAGLGRDAMVLASLGCQVTAIERLPALALLLHCAVQDTALASRLTVQAGDALPWLLALGPAERPDVVYLDPMFGNAGKAQVKKEMQVCRLLAGPAEDPGPLLAAARGAATDRVVVKRHHGEAPVAADVAFAVEGERVRFDVYLAPSPR